MASTSAKRSRASAEQLSHMVDFMISNPGLAGGKFKKLHGKLECDMKWSELCDTLNSLGGAVKAVSQWQAVWKELKSRTNTKVRDRKRQQELTGNKPLIQEALSEMERRVISVISSDYIKGHASVAENVPMEENLQLLHEDGEEIVDPLDSEAFDLQCDTPSTSRRTPRRGLKRKRAENDSETKKEFLEIARKQSDALKMLAEQNKIMTDAIRTMGEGLKETAIAITNLGNVISKIKMSHHSDDQLLEAGSDSFWEPGNYKRTTKRIEDGYKLCNDLQQLIQERADIEKAYAKSLRAWSKKWGELIEKGPEYGTTEAAWKGVLTESERISDVHMKIKENLCTDVSLQIKSWQKDNYHHTLMQIKERKDMEDLFKKAQKTWAKLLAKVEKAKAEYHAACKTEKSATNQERNATADSSLSLDQVKKMHDRVQKTKDQVQKCREKYEQAIAEITKYNSVYIEDMTSVFEKCQTMEKTRLQFFKEVLFNLHAVLDLTKVPSLPQIYEEFYHTINNADHQKDLKWWSNNHGVNMAMNWPAFVEYTEEFRDIAKGNKSKEALPAAPITLINQRPVNEDLHEYSGSSSLKKSNNISSTLKSTGKHQQQDSSATSPTTVSASTLGTTTTNKTNTNTHNRNSSVTNGKSNSTEANPFEEEEEWDEGDNVLVDNGEPGVPVKALYDYEGAESDELTFKQGDIFEKLEDEDEQGWCKGRMNGRVGLYPANYVEPIQT